MARFYCISELTSHQMLCWPIRCISEDVSPIYFHSLIQKLDLKDYSFYFPIYLTFYELDVSLTGVS